MEVYAAPDKFTGYMWSWAGMIRKLNMELKQRQRRRWSAEEERCVTTLKDGGENVTTKSNWHSFKIHRSNSVPFNLLNFGESEQEYVWPDNLTPYLLPFSQERSLGAIHRVRGGRGRDILALGSLEGGISYGGTSAIYFLYSEEDRKRS